jgi:predicted nucleotidyltransferase component of viral defense system
LDVTTNEVLAFPAARRGILHPYSDADALADAHVPCYALVEMLAEKVRALTGQRQYAISRDLYDLAELTERGSVDVARVAAALPGKLAGKGVAASRADVERLRQRRDGFRADWQRNLVHLLPPGVTTSFEAAWVRALDFITRVNEA